MHPVIPHRTALAKALLAIVIFGTAPAAIKSVSLDSYALGIARLTLATLGMSLMMAARPGARPTLAADYRRAWPGLVVMGVFFGLHWLTYFIAIKWGSPSMSEVGFSTYGAQLPLLGWMFGFGRPKAVTLVSVALALFGTWLCLGDLAWSSDDAGSLLIGVLSGTMYAALPMLHQHYANIDSQLRTWAQFCFALPMFLLLAPWATWSMSGRDVWLVIHLGLVVTLVAHYLWVQATTVLPIQVTSVVGYFQLPASLLMNWLLLGSKLTPAMKLGAACVVAANLLTVGMRARWSRREQRHPTPPAQRLEGEEPLMDADKR